MARKDFSRGFQNFNRLVRAIRIRGDRSLFWRPAAAREALATSIFANTMPPDLIPEDPESAGDIPSLRPLRFAPRGLKKKLRESLGRGVHRNELKKKWGEG